MQPDGRAYLLGNKGDFNLSVTLERVPGAAGLDGCEKAFRARVESKVPVKLSDVKQSRTAGMAVLEYRVAKFQGVRIEQKNVFGCLAKGDVYIDIHLSKVSFAPADQALLMQILNSGRFTAVAADSLSTQSEAVALVAQGGNFFRPDQFDQAIELYQRALDMEKETQELSDLHLRLLIDNLAMALGITGKLDRAEEVLRYGLSRDSAYPLFYYILANVRAEQNDLENTLKYLRLALKYKKNVIPGERLPDPLGDDSFTRFLEDDRFRKVAAKFR